MAKLEAQPGKRRGVPPAPPPEAVDPVWLLKAFAITVAIALVCGYLTLCGLFYRGQWQLVLHPVRTAGTPETAGGVPFERVSFGTYDTGVPQLIGWWIPAVPGSKLSSLTMLYLPGGDGSLAGDQAQLASLHDAGASILAIDYRGYGRSADRHPGEQSMREDVESAWTYLTQSRHVPGGTIVPYGSGVGAALALALAAEKPPVPAVILDDPDFGVTERVARDPRAKFVPVRLLFYERFDLAPMLFQSQKPKLILTRASREDPAAMRAADPKMTVALPDSAAHQLPQIVSRFLDQYAHTDWNATPPAGSETTQ